MVKIIAHEYLFMEFVHSTYYELNQHFSGLFT